MFCWSIHPLVDTGLIPPFWLLWIMLLCMHKCLFETLLPILWGIYPGVGSLDHREMLYLIFLRNCHTVFHGGYTLHSYQQCTRILISPHLHQHLPFTSLSLFCFSKVAILMGVSCILLWFWFAFPQWLVMLSICVYLFVCLLAIYISSLVKYLFKSFAQVSVGLFDLLIMFYKTEVAETHLKTYSTT